MEPSSLVPWAVAAGTSPIDAQETGRALLLWLLVAAALGAFLIGIVLVSISRRNRRAERSAQPSADLDAWKSAAERITPPAPPEDRA